ncbi:bifunctional ADP-dependent (S)-NAD(P)H-hydrate dehydratase/NAD(P)H-hydrate epimerase [Erwinia sp. OLTSP20]|uniref:bifunctional ADP-dependent NAD(P)H-hydrate dehydratase/NAD(P)H-hydrate epimerase n=1 Tax=unclassified Erwinia TaxID=2622719 RepID=UPI000C17B1FF|nr:MULTISPECIES: bifunctional ADP-dependent NAD(P)H-hydrate dehydratase/NAD(P)H-hydrate epimerase [unclassified Erwinia]PIJ52076.1 bifunctional ADP-dependent (S)-NAD(P)H-hydrate dehydratase/NAD(P)H-hydrate epimerase [Erwinia sp. OAMSP11]PIJ75239.1 bifunctional ADP-dependent (S)-NAD(P)H-hydrate dehydratase/NAD(P)H-hydrate epimerase [Erwinia sp. OLSSP12]PIJ84446.1 bifunctional ADP-dependent (S)-NAD(P)H-hydrate dehydratase/NAD(P)H-hydrate epimerase [Erwinia sp. OLCASP19]PIJ87060.1 bifunctional ADP
MTDLHSEHHGDGLPHSLWPAGAMAALEKEAADALGLTLYELMLRAGEAAFQLIQQRWPRAAHLLILCGHGNNGGDGYVVARLAQSAGLTVTLLACEGSRSLPDEAQQAREAWLAAGGVIHAADAPWPENVEVIVDALLGTGLNRAPRSPYAELIRQVNNHPAAVFSIDIPSGLVAENGTTPGAVVNADATLTFIALKPGLLTGKARDHVGRLSYHALGLTRWLAGQNAPWSRIDSGSLTGWLSPRRASSHKGDNGRLVMIGGDRGTAGAIRLAAEAAVRSGAGLVRVITHADNIGPLLTARPELMVDELSEHTLADALEWADVIVIGPGLGQGDWGKQALKKAENTAKPMLWDADALNLLAIRPDKRQNRIITPHPGEAARLLNVSIGEIEGDRVAAAQRLAKRYGGVVVLKGAGTIIASQQAELAIADVGNPGMASGGMGDVLAGIIGALTGQKLSLYDAACAGCVVHGAAADRVAGLKGPRGMLASDLFSQLYLYLNPEMLIPLK